MKENMLSISELRTKFEKDYRSGRNNIILLIILTLVNIALAIFSSGSYFLFSAQIPYFIFLVGFIASGYSAFSDSSIEMFPFPSILIITSVIAAIIILLYLLCFIFSGKNRYGWLIGALVLYMIDTFFTLAINIPEFGTDAIIDIVFHIAIIISLVKSIVAGVKLSKLPPDDDTLEESTDPIQSDLQPQITESTEPSDITE